MSSITERKKSAIVVGGGLAGLMSAGALADHFDSVTVVERDPIASYSGVVRKGVPQGSHIHVLWSTGAQMLERLFPGLFEELEQAGAVAFDNSEDMRWYHGGVWKLRIRSGMRMYSQSRPLLEGHVFARVRRLPNVSFCQGSVESLDVSGGRVRGVRLNDKDAVLSADLVVDASGRGSRLPRWLEDAGCERVVEQTVGIDLRYASRLYRIDHNTARDWKCMAVYARPPRSKKSGVIFPIEGDRWIVTLGGCLGDHPGTAESGFLEFARSLDQPDLYQAISTAEPLSEVSYFSYPAEVWRRYDLLRDFPGGLAVIGDALCSFNPLYGQGITVAAKEAVALSRLFRSPSLAEEEAGEKILQQTRAIIRDPWMLACGNDLLYPGAVGDRPIWLNVMGGYTDEVLRLSESDPQVLDSFLKVLHLARSPAYLFHPRTLTRVLASRFKKRNYNTRDSDVAG